MAKESASKPTTSSASSWWSERGKITSRKSGTAAAKPKKKVRTKKAAKAESGQTYYCEICGCEMVCASDSAGEIICCEEPMCLVI
ncbi:Uncharacterised protein [uncultured archaeon]|nr:Uncharacterised protein [uncultured archaeon]